MTATLSQPVEFLAALYGGMLIGLIYDAFRLLRLPFPKKKLINAVFDFIFYAAAGGTSALILLYLCDGAVRAYHILGIGGGVFLQQFFLSRPIRRGLLGIRTKIQQNLQKKSARKAGNPAKAENKNSE